MKKKLSVIILFLITIHTYSQEENANYGIKGGANYGKFISDENASDYQYQAGFYAGFFYNFKLEEKWRFQPELLFALQGSKIISKENEITDVNGNRLPNTSTFDFEYGFYELTLSIPLAIKLYVSENLYFEAGPQMGLIIDRKVTSSQSLLDGSDNSFIKDGNGNFDFGVLIGTGYDISKDVSINLRVYNGLINRNDNVKPLVFNLGIEYNL